MIRENIILVFMKLSPYARTDCAKEAIHLDYAKGQQLNTLGPEGHLLR